MKYIRSLAIALCLTLLLPLAACGEAEGEPVADTTEAATVTAPTDTPADTLPFFAKYGFEDDGETNGLHAMHILGENVQLSHCGGNCATCHSRSEECIPKALR